MSEGKLVNMSLVTVEVEFDHGRVTPEGPDALPDKAAALLTILCPMTPSRNPLQPDPELQRVKFFEDPTQPLDPEDWPEALT